MPRTTRPQSGRRASGGPNGPTTFGSPPRWRGAGTSAARRSPRSPRTWGCPRPWCRGLMLSRGVLACPRPVISARDSGPPRVLASRSTARSSGFSKPTRRRRRWQGWLGVAYRPSVARRGGSNSWRRRRSWQLQSLRTAPRRAPSPDRADRRSSGVRPEGWHSRSPGRIARRRQRSDLGPIDNPTSLAA
jgi:hypothetical protein